MSKITNVIPRQHNEVVRDQIAIILADEIENQVLIAYDPELELTVYCSRTKTFDKTEVPAINVSLASGNYANKNQGSVDGTYIYNIDVYTNSADKEDTDGDVLSSVLLEKILGICRYILEDPIYKTLGFAPGFIMRTGCTVLQIAQPERLDDKNHMMGRIQFSVTANESNKLLIPALIESYKTTLKINQSNAGYLYVGGTDVD